MRHLPYLTGHAKDRRVTGHHFELARESLGQSYLEDAPDDELRHARDPLGLYKNDIPPWAFRLTIGWRGGTNYIYDTKIVSRTLLLHCALSVPRSQWHIVWLAISNSTIAFKASHMTPGLTLYIPMVLSHCSQKP